MTYTFTIEPNPTQEDSDILHQKIRKFNYEKVGMVGSPLDIFVRDEQQQIVGGIIGWYLLNSLFVDVLIVDDDLRHHGYGTQLMELAEQAAKQRGCKFVHLDTFSFQALPFYRNLGYQIYGVLEYKPDLKRYYLKKEL